MREKFYLTSAITYTSGKPHVGNSYEVVLCDAMARFKRLQGFDVFFMTGTDEHGLKIEQKAEAAGKSPKEFVDGVADEIKGLWKLMNVEYDKFIRTTDTAHEEVVKKIFEKFYKQGDIYKGGYEGMYCTPCESFWTESQLVDGKCPDCGREVKFAREEAYFFGMSKYAPRLLEHFLTHPDFLQPTSRRREMMNNFILDDSFAGKTDEELLSACKDGTIKTKLQDLCVSRSTFKWGIPVPFDSKHVTYVWLDALTNYITGIGYDPDGASEKYKKLWPADVHVIGKDIVRFHTIYWPIFLMALGEPLPKTVFGHPWIVTGGDKMSKSKGNVLYVDELASFFGVDAVRYCLLHEMPYGDDGLLTRQIIKDRVNSDLANVLGNLVKRTVAMAGKYFGGTVKSANAATEFDDDLINTVKETPAKVAAKMDAYKVSDALDALWALFRRSNKYIDETCPWVLAKDETKKPVLENVLYNLIAAIEIGANLLKPFLPASSEKILKEIGGGIREFDTLTEFKLTPEYTVTNAPETLFERIDDMKFESYVKAAEMPAVEIKEEQVEHKAQITIDDFAKIELRVGKVIACEAVKKSKLLHETIKVGDKTLSVLSGIANHYTAEDMVGKKVIVVCNLPPREMKGIMSEGMIVCAEAPDGTLSIVSPEKDLPDGSVLS